MTTFRQSSDTEKLIHVVERAKAAGISRQVLPPYTFTS